MALTVLNVKRILIVGSKYCRFYHKELDYNELVKIKTRQNFIIMRNQKRKTPPSSISIQVVGNGGLGMPTGVFIHCDNQKYLFNCGEGLQRLSNEYHIKLLRISQIFITSVRWRNLSGLPGMGLTLKSGGADKVTINGPEGINDLFNDLSLYNKFQHLKVQFTSADKSPPPIVDNAMRVDFVPLVKSTVKDEPEEYVTIDVYDTALTNNNGKRIRLAAQLEHAKKKKVAVSSHRVTNCVAYICKFHPQLGKLNIEKCVDMNIPIGPLLGELKAGKDITLPDGTTVYAKDVTDPPQPGNVVIVLECPSEDYLESLETSEAFANHDQTAKEEHDKAHMIVHFTPPSVLNTDRYKAWMKRFPKTTKHLLVNEDNDHNSSETIYKMQYQLGLMSSDVFPPLGEKGCIIDKPNPVIDTEKIVQKFIKDESTGEKEASETGEAQCTRQVESSEQAPEKTKCEDNSEELQIYKARSMLSYHLRPNDGFDEAELITIKPREYIQSAFDLEGFTDSLAELQTKIAEKAKSLSKSEYPKIVMLGTGSAVPSKNRNTSGIIIQVDEDTSIICDCGEGTAASIVQFFGRENLEKFFKTVKMIYVSHMHADHYIGIAGILQLRSKFNDEPVMLLAPAQLKTWLQVIHIKFDPIFHMFNLVSNRDMLKDRARIDEQTKQRVLDCAKLANVETEFVKHCSFAYGVVFTLKENNYKIVYSGDTLPDAKLIHLGYECDFLIHEATMEDDLEDEARLKLHSTTSQAIAVSKQMKARFTLLTHFSQRYAKVPRIFYDEKNLKELQTVGIAFDNMVIRSSQVSLLPLLYPTLNKLYSAYILEMDSRTLRRELSSMRSQ